MMEVIVLMISAAAQSNVTAEAAFEIARSIGDYAGYTPTPARKMDYELIDRPDTPLYPGFVTVQIMSNAHDIFDLSIRITDGAVFDFNHCLVFNYPFLRKQNKGGAGRRSREYRPTMEANGCVDFRILRRPGDEGLPLPLVKNRNTSSGV